MANELTKRVLERLDLKHLLRPAHEELFDKWSSRLSAAGVSDEMIIALFEDVYVNFVEGE